jgi:hypothetical protein
MREELMCHSSLLFDGCAQDAVKDTVYASRIRARVRWALAKSRLLAMIVQREKELEVQGDGVFGGAQ